MTRTSSGRMVRHRNNVALSCCSRFVSGVPRESPRSRCVHSVVDIAAEDVIPTSPWYSFSRKLRRSALGKTRYVGTLRISSQLEKRNIDQVSFSNQRRISSAFIGGCFWLRRRPALNLGGAVHALGCCVVRGLSERVIDERSRRLGVACWANISEPNMSGSTVSRDQRIFLPMLALHGTMEHWTSALSAGQLLWHGFVCDFCGEASL